ncbi:MAG: hypothetical protein QM602_01435 [Microbacterium sp.]
MSDSHDDRQATDEPTARDVPLTDAYRLLRRVAAPEAPCPGWLARRADGETVHLVQPDAVGSWNAQSAPGGGHVLVPCDLVRTPAGVLLELPWCRERLDRLLARRGDLAAPLSAGEAVTLAISLRRGLAETAAARSRSRPEWPTGEWWMTDSARPMFVPLAAGSSAPAATGDALERVSGATDDAATRAAIERLRVAAELDPLADGAHEEELFRLGEPAPVVMTGFAPARARSVDAATRLAADEIVAPAPGGWRARWVRQRDSDLPGMVSDAVHRALRGLRARPRPKPWLLAGGAAALVLAAGLLWPTGSPPPAQARDEQAASADPSPSPSPSPLVSASSAPSPSPGLAQTLAELLDERAACADDRACLAAVVETPERDFPTGAVDAPADERTIVLLDEFGGAAVLRVEPTDASTAAQLVVIVEADGRWLLRDVHDVAQQG